MCFKKGAANGHPKVERMTIITIFLHKQVGGRPAAILNLCKVPVVLFVPSFGDIGKLQKKLRNFDTQAADIRRTFSFSTNSGELT